jgi:hypothetical protein
MPTLRPRRSHAAPMPRCAVALRSRFQKGIVVEKHGPARVRHGIANQTQPHCVNQMGKTQSKPLAARHGICELALTKSLLMQNCWCQNVANQTPKWHKNLAVCLSVYRKSPQTCSPVTRRPFCPTVQKRNERAQTVEPRTTITTEITF